MLVKWEIEKELFDSACSLRSLRRSCRACPCAIGMGCWLIEDLAMLVVAHSSYLSKPLAP